MYSDAYAAMVCPSLARSKCRFVDFWSRDSTNSCKRFIAASKESTFISGLINMRVSEEKKTRGFMQEGHSAYPKIKHRSIFMRDYKMIFDLSKSERFARSQVGTTCFMWADVSF